MRNDQDITFWLVRVLEAGTVVFLFDLRDQGIKSADDIFGRSGSNAKISTGVSMALAVSAPMPNTIKLNPKIM